jgi:hypothetical protein
VAKKRVSRILAKKENLIIGRKYHGFERIEIWKGDEIYLVLSRKKHYYIVLQANVL